jgi:hypothetical protein
VAIVAIRHVNATLNVSGKLGAHAPVKAFVPQTHKQANHVVIVELPLLPATQTAIGGHLELVQGKESAAKVIMLRVITVEPCNAIANANGGTVR